MNKPVTTQIHDDGLRYRSKAGGSPFGKAANTRSCFKCGQHRPMDALQTKRILGRIEMICKPACGERG